jgi:hypothetical protein
VPTLLATPSADPAAQAAVLDRAWTMHRSVEHPAVELTEVLADAVAAGIVERDDAELIARSRIGGQRVADIAQHRGLRPRTLWDRRQRAEDALVSARLAG